MGPMAELKDTLRTDMTAAMKAKDKATVQVIRSVMSAFTAEETAGSAHELTTEQELAILRKQARQRRDSAAAYLEGGRPDLAESENAEADILEGYLPTPLTAEELDALVDAEIAALGEEPTMKHMGALVKAVNAKAEGRAEGKAVADAVRSRLS